MQSRSNSSNLAPFLWALGTTVPAYLMVWLMTGLMMLAAASAALAALMAFIACRLIQLRGRLTLAITVIGIPLLAAILFSSYQALNPLIQRQRSISMLRQAGITTGGRPADQFGEWKRDQRGFMLPVWLVDRIGPDCMTRLSSIDAELSNLDRVPYRTIDTSDLARVQLARLGEHPELSADLVDWLNTLDLKQLNIGLTGFSIADEKALTGLRQPYHAHLYLDETARGSLSAFAAARSLALSGERLTVEQAQQLSQLTDLFLQLNVRTLSADCIAALGAGPSMFNVVVQTGQLDANGWQALAKLPVQHLSLEIQDPTSLQNAPASLQNATHLASGNRVTSLNMTGTEINFEDAQLLIGIFRPEQFRASLELDDGQIELLWRDPRLQEINLSIDDRWHRHRRE